MAIPGVGRRMVLFMLGIFLGVALLIQYTRTQYPTYRSVTIVVDIWSYLLSFITRPLIRRFFIIPESDWNRDREVEGLENPVDVYKDDMGIPYIFAHTERDAHLARSFVEYSVCQLQHFAVHLVKESAIWYFVPPQACIVLSFCRAPSSSATTTTYPSPSASHGCCPLLLPAILPLHFPSSAVAPTFAADLFYAPERPFQYEFLRRLAMGRLAESFGEDLVSIDFHTRIHMDSDYLRYQLGSMPPEKLTLLEASVNAINQAARMLPATPVEFAVLGWTHTDWTALEYLHVLQALALQLSRGFTIDYTRAALHHHLKEYWTAFDLGTAKNVPPLNIEGEFPSLFNQKGERAEMPRMPTVDNAWAKWRPKDVEKMLESLRSTQADGSQQQEQHKVQPATEQRTTPTGARSFDTVNTAAWSGSNGWAVSGRFTASGKPLLASDTHLQAVAPGFWMPMFVSVGPSKLLSGGSSKRRHQQQHRVIGASPVGAASIFVGHNGQAAWGQTVSHTDAADLYLVQLNREGTHYYYDGKWCPLRIRIEEFSVKGKPEKVEKTARYTHHGPLFSDSVPIFDAFLKPGEAVAIAAVAGRAPISLDYPGQLASAATWQQFLKAGSLNEQLGLVTVWATAEGDVGATVSGAIPVRSPPRERHRFRDGSSSAADWQGVLPQTRLPNVVNPRKGYVGVGNSKLSEDPDEMYGNVFTPGYRQQRVNERLQELTARGKLKAEDMIEMQNDVHSISNKAFRDYALRTILFAYKPATDASAKLEFADQQSITVRAVCTEEGLSEVDGRWLYTTMGQWNGDMAVDSVAATVSDVWQQWVLQKLFNLHGFSEEALNVLLGGQVNDVWLPAFEILNHWTYNLLRALEDREDVITDVSSSERLLCSGAASALEWLRLRYGASSDGWTWGNVRARFIDHPIGAAVPLLRHTASVGPLRWGGNFGTIKSHHVSAKAMSLENPLNGAYGKALDTPVLRMVVDLGNLKNSFWSVLPGVSGWVGSKHYDNFAHSIEATTGTDHMRPMLWTDDQIEKASVTHMRLLPKKLPPEETKKQARRKAEEL